MSRIGKRAVIVPKEVQVSLKENVLTVKGPKGVLHFRVPALAVISIKEGEVVVTRKGDERRARACHGLVRNQVQNMVQGVTQMFTKNLEIRGVGYRADVKGKDLQLSLGFSHPVLYPIPEGIQIQVKKQVEVTLQGCDKVLVGQTAANIRGLKLPEPYQGKGIRYLGEVVRQKVGKQAAGATGGGG